MWTQYTCGPVLIMLAGCNFYQPSSEEPRSDCGMHSPTIQPDNTASSLYLTSAHQPITSTKSARLLLPPIMSPERTFYNTLILACIIIIIIPAFVHHSKLPQCLSCFFQIYLIFDTCLLISTCGISVHHGRCTQRNEMHVSCHNLRVYEMFSHTHSNNCSNANVSRTKSMSWLRCGELVLHTH